MRLGFVGTGSIASALVSGLCASDCRPDRILVSPRNAGKAAELAARFARVEVAADNQAVLDGSDCVFVAVLPTRAAEVLEPLRFRPDHLVISVVALLPLAEARRLVGPAEAVHRAVPLPSAVRRLGPIAYHPAGRRVENLLALVGTPVAAASEREFNVLWALTALIAPYFTLVEEAASWAAEAGADPGTAEAYLKSMFHGLAALAAEPDAGPVADLAAEARTPGGLNEQALAEIHANGGYRAFRAALESILARIGEPK